MDITLTYQAFSFFVMVFCGSLCGVIFDLFRSFRRNKKSACGIVALQDIVFWIMELFLVYMVAFRLNYAHIRAYEGIALLLGSWLYFMTVSKWVLNTLCALLSYVQKAFGFVLIPFKKTMGFFGRCASGIKKTVLSKSRQTVIKLKSMQKHLQKSKNIFTI